MSPKAQPVERRESVLEALSTVADEARNALAVRGRLVIQAHQAGASLRAIAAAAGLSVEGIRKIIQRGDQ